MGVVSAAVIDHHLTEGVESTDGEVLRSGACSL